MNQWLAERLLILQCKTEIFVKGFWVIQICSFIARNEGHFAPSVKMTSVCNAHAHAHASVSRWRSEKGEN